MTGHSSDRTDRSRAHEAPHRDRSDSSDLTGHERLAQVLAEHHEVPTRVGSACSGCEWFGFSHRSHLAEAVLASGVVVSADRVRALADRVEAATGADCADLDDHATGDSCGRCLADDLMPLLRALLVEPATDAAPTVHPCEGCGDLTSRRVCRNCYATTDDPMFCGKCNGVCRLEAGCSPMREDRNAAPTGEAQTGGEQR